MARQKQPREIIREAIEGEKKDATKVEKVEAEAQQPKQEIRQEVRVEAGHEELEEFRPISDEESMIEIVKKASVSPQELHVFMEKVRKFLGLPEEERRRRVMKFVEFVSSLFRTKPEVEAGIEVLRLLATKPEALIYFSYMWKPQYRELVLGLLYWVVYAARNLGMQI